MLREDEVCLIPNEVMVRVEDAPSNSRRIFCAIDIFASVDEVSAQLALGSVSHRRESTYNNCQVNPQY